MKWINLKENKPSIDLMINRDVLIRRSNGSFSNGVFHYDENQKIYSMSYGGTTKHLDLWKYKPTHWLDVKDIEV